MRDAAVAVAPLAEAARLGGRGALTVREPREEDAEALVRVHERCWTISHAPYADPSWVVGRPRAERIEQWRAYARGEGFAMLVAERDGEVVGFVAFGASRDADAPAATGEVVAIYVDPDEQGRGTGGALLQGAVEGLRAQGLRRATLWTLRDSPQSNGFYAAHGWRRDGTEKDDREFGAVEVRYEREL